MRTNITSLRQSTARNKSSQSRFINNCMEYVRKITYVINDINKYRKKYKKAYSSSKKAEYLNKVENAYEKFSDIYDKLFDTYMMYRDNLMNNKTNSLRKTGLVTGAGWFRNSDTDDTFKKIYKYLQISLNNFPNYNTLDINKTLEYTFEILTTLMKFNDVVKGALVKIGVQWKPLREAMLYRIPNSKLLHTSVRATMHPSTKRQSLSSRTTQQQPKTNRFTDKQREELKSMMRTRNSFIKHLKPKEATMVKGIVKEIMKTHIKNTTQKSQTKRVSPKSRSLVRSAIPATKVNFCHQCAIQCKITQRKPVLSPILESPTR